MEKEYIVSLNVRFITPLGVKASGEKQAESRAITEFKKRWEEMKKKLDDIADLEIDLDYVEDAS